MCRLCAFWWRNSFERCHKDSRARGGCDGGIHTDTHHTYLYGVFEIGHRYIGFDVAVSTQKHNSIIEESNSNAHIYFMAPINRWKINKQTAVPYVASIDCRSSPISADEKHMDSSNFIFRFSFHSFRSKNGKKLWSGKNYVYRMYLISGAM